MENNYLSRIAQGEKILFSELLADPPSDEVLAWLFRDIRFPKAQDVDRAGLEVLKLSLLGLRLPEIAGQLGLTYGQAAYRSQKMISALRRGVPDCIAVDIPALRRRLGLPIAKSGGYTLLSELLRDMPSDEELLCLFTERGNVMGRRGKVPTTNSDLQLLQMRREGRSYEYIGAQTGMEAGEVRRRVKLILERVGRNLRIRIDIPELYKPRRVPLLPEEIRGGGEEGQDREPIFFSLTRAEMKTILQALEVYEKQLEDGGGNQELP